MLWNTTTMCHGEIGKQIETHKKNEYSYETQRKASIIKDRGGDHRIEQLVISQITIS